VSDIQIDIVELDTSRFHLKKIRM